MYLKPNNWYLYISVFIIVALSVIYIYLNKQNILLKNNYIKITEENVISKNEIEKQNLLINSSEIENNSLINDYSYVDSLFYVEKTQATKLQFEINKYRNLYSEALKENNELTEKIKKYQTNNTLLVSELQQAKVNIKNISNFVDSLKLLIENISNNNKIDLKFLSENRLIFASASGCKYSKKGKEVTKKIKDVNFINIYIKTIKGLNFELGSKELYVRIADPNGKILPFKEYETFSYNNEEISFSNKQSIKFNNNSFPIEISYNPKNKLIEGVYWVYIFLDGHKICETSFDLI